MRGLTEKAVPHPVQAGEESLKKLSIDERLPRPQ
jgi:hypothetical protein